MNPYLNAAIANLDLEPVAYKLRTKLKWPEERIEQAIEAYRKFLQQVRDAGQGAYHRPTSEDVDEVWHAHILHTRKYAEDCAAALGWFFHHTPDPQPEKAAQSAPAQESSCGGLTAWMPAWLMDFIGPQPTASVSTPHVTKGGVEAGPAHVADAEAGDGKDSGTDADDGGAGDADGGDGSGDGGGDGGGDGCGGGGCGGD